MRQMINNTKLIIEKEIGEVEHKQKAVKKSERRFEERISRNERLLSRKVRLSEMQLEEMEKWAKREIERMKKERESAIRLLRLQLITSVKKIEEKYQNSLGKDQLPATDAYGNRNGGMEQMKINRTGLGNSSLVVPDHLRASKEEIMEMSGAKMRKYLLALGLPVQGTNEEIRQTLINAMFPPVIEEEEEQEQQGS